MKQKSSLIFNVISRLYLAIMLLSLTLGTGTNIAYSQSNLTEEQKQLINMLYLPQISVNLNWTYKPSDFDTLRYGNIDEKINIRKNKIRSLDLKKSPEIIADLNYEIAALFRVNAKNDSAKPYINKAFQIYKDLSNKNPKSASLLYKLGLTSLIMEDSDKTAKEYFKQSAKVDPDYYPVYIELFTEIPEQDTIKIVEQKYWREKGEECFKRNISKKEMQKNADFYYNYFIFRFSTSVFDFMSNIYKQRTSQIDTDSSAIYTIMDYFDAILNDYNIELLKKAVEIQPNNLEYRGSLSAIQVGKIYREFFSILIGAIDKSEGDSSEVSIFNYAMKLTNEKYRDKFIEAEETTTFIDKQAKDFFPALYYNWGLLKVMEGKLDLAEKYIVKAISLNSSESNYYESLLTIYRIYIPEGKSVNQEKLDYFSTLLKDKCNKNKCTSKEYFLLAKIEFDKENYSSAEMFLREALFVDPSYFHSRIGLGITLMKEHKFQLAVKEISKAEELVVNADNKDKAYFCSVLGILYLFDGNKNEARNWFQKALEFDPDESTAKKFIDTKK